MSINKKFNFFAIHGGSDSWFAAKSASEALYYVNQFNEVAMEYETPPTSRVLICDNPHFKKMWEKEMQRRNESGVSTNEYFTV